ncbi:hypothetical protein GDI2804 [Gluconacetobacter diazotrophicus PA1 5]|uniref:Uncharacterized protein n=1 Tax=Gluconacetobacter diazotrophicus (strain ATCC 49037 / DSM 5601 / CCUG 37298 / CIP 103539 / LMG 7603 / PAl5) TaxID=272568 RepID=A9HQI2_GLUDA|nr:hypothetical protein GDI2804 [Gluconacetobacter diazotrophicus PA1 5]
MVSSARSIWMWSCSVVIVLFLSFLEDRTDGSCRGGPGQGSPQATGSPARGGADFVRRARHGCVGQNWGDHVSLTRFALAHGTMGRLRESLAFLLRLTSGDQHDRPHPGRSREKKTRKAPLGETGRGWVWEVQSPFRLRGRVQIRE